MLNYTDEFWSWIEAHLNEDPAKLTLKFHGKSPWIDDAIMQVQCRRKTKKKLEREIANPQFYFPSTLSAEQCTGDSLALFHASLINRGDSLVDLTCGLGIDSLHFAEIAKSVTSVEQNQKLCEALKHNSAALGFPNITVVNSDCIDFLKETKQKYDVAFIDPARRGSAGERVFGLHDCSPDVIEMLPLIKEHCRRLIIKASPMLDLTQIIRDLPLTSAIYVTGNDTECKEIVIVADFESDNLSEPDIHARSASIDFVFKKSEEAEATAVFSEPREGGFLYEPNPEIMKAAPFKLLSQMFKIDKIGSNTHLYWSRDRVEDFPGNVFCIKRLLDYSSGNIKRFSREFPVIRVTARNFGMTADQLRKKLKVKDGGELRLFAATTINEKKIMIVASEEA